MVNEPLTPYAGTSGWSGSDASRERAEREDSNGTTSQRQSQALAYADVFGHTGVTVKDLREMTDWHHGQASGVLSVLHKEGRLVRLAEKRDRCHVYVLPEHVSGRVTQPHGRSRKATLTTEEEEAVTRLQSLLDSRDVGVWALYPNAAVRSVLAALRRLT